MTSIRALDRGRHVCMDAMRIIHSGRRSVRFSTISPTGSSRGVYYADGTLGAVWMLPARQLRRQAAPPALDFGRLELRLIAWQASSGQGALQTSLHSPACMLASPALFACPPRARAGPEAG